MGGGGSSADGSSADKENIDITIIAFYFPADKWGLKIDSGGEEEFSPQEIAVVKSIAKVIKKKVRAEEVRLRTSVEEETLFLHPNVYCLQMRTRRLPQGLLLTTGKKLSPSFHQTAKAAASYALNQEVV
jgi:hypothetical protein